MPELPDVLLYIESLEPRILRQQLERVRLASPFVVRSVAPPLSRIHGRTVRTLSRLGKQIIWEFDGDLFLVVHLMIAGRFQWKERYAKIPGKLGLAAFDRGALEILDSTPAAFKHALTTENHTVKRALTDPRFFSGIGNAYSDEILHRARLSPMKLTSKLSGDEIARLHKAAKSTLKEWIERLRTETGSDFPSKVTAFRPEMAVHGRYGKPCPDCGSPVQRIVYAENECNYCATCQTEGRLLADRALSRLLKRDWPRSLDEWETHLESRR